MSRYIPPLVVLLLAFSDLPQQSSALVGADRGSTMTMNVSGGFGVISKVLSRKRPQPSVAATFVPNTALSAKLTGMASTGGNSATSIDDVTQPPSRPMKISVDTSNFGADDTVRTEIRNAVYQRSLHRLLCDDEEECIF
mmetsp:Transcript_34479/g.75464  ORF Transcript_34479/g.75464 Transcript_34479/m.75464 type:complete len:139 (-) Transcript_34479:210-626(-)